MRLQDSMITMLRHAGRSRSTESAYCREFRRFLCSLGHDRPLRVRRADVVSYLDTVGSASPSRRRMAHAALRFFYVHVVARPEVVAAIPWPRAPRSLREGPRWSDADKVVEAVSDPVARAVLSVIAASGLRIGEAISLRVEDVQPARDAQGRKLDQGVLVVRHGKGGKARLAPLGPTLLSVLREYWRAVRPVGFLFPAWRRHASHICDVKVRQELRAACLQVGVPVVTPHQLRHTFATTMLERGVDLPTLQSALGHARPSTTAIYLHVRRDRVAAMPDLLAGPSKG